VLEKTRQEVQELRGRSELEQISNFLTKLILSEGRMAYYMVSGPV